MSKKLENNGLWQSSRMMLPEHKEALVQRKADSPADRLKPGLPTEEELKLIRNFVLLPIMLTIVETNLQSIETSSYPLKKLYINATQALIQLIRTELTQVKKALSSKGIKIYEEEKNDRSLRFRFVCRGYEDSFFMIRDVVRAEISVRIAQYINLLFREPADRKAPLNG